MISLLINILKNNSFLSNKGDLEIISLNQSDSGNSMVQVSYKKRRA